MSDGDTLRQTALSAYTELRGGAPGAPRLALRMAAQVVTAPAACSDALLLHAEALRACAWLMDDLPAEQRNGLRVLADLVAARAPALVLGCAS